MKLMATVEDGKGVIRQGLGATEKEPEKWTIEATDRSRTRTARRTCTRGAEAAGAEAAGSIIYYTNVKVTRTRRSE